MGTIDLRKYLEQVRCLENDVQTLHRTEFELNRHKKQLPSHQSFVASVPPKPPTAPNPPQVENINCTPDVHHHSVFWPILCAYLACCVACSVHVVLMQKIPSFLGLLIYFIIIPLCVFFIVKNKLDDIDTKRYIHEKARMTEEAKTKMWSEYEQKMEQYRIQMEQYHTQKEQYDQASHQEYICYQQEREQIRFFNQGIEAEIRSIIETRRATLQVLGKVYSLNIIYPKYRNILAITKFCEYLDSGRRSTLNGANGMYDLFELESHHKAVEDALNRINSGIGTIINKLDDISYTMYENHKMLYTELQRGIQIATKLSNNTTSMLEQCIAQCTAMGASLEESNAHLAHIRASSEISAFNSELTARRTDAIANIAEFEYALRH